MTKVWLHWLAGIAMLSCAMCAQAANDYIVAPSGGDITGTQLSNNLANGNVTLKSSDGSTPGSGNVIINDVVTWSANTTLTLTASNNVIINANISASSDNAGLVISPATANGGESKNPTGIYSLNGSSITLSGITPSLSIAGTTYTVINNLGTAADATKSPSTPTLQGMAATDNLAKNFALGSDIDASVTSTWNSGAGFTPIGDGSKPKGPSPDPFTGKFNGLGHTISNLTINLPGQFWGVGLFGDTGKGSEIRNVSVVNADITGNHRVGGLAGENSGLIYQSHAKSTVTGINNIAGLVGYNTSSGRVENSYTTGNVIASGDNVGGLVGANSGITRNSYSTSDVSSAGNNVGGLVGANWDLFKKGPRLIENCYSSGQVSYTGSGDFGGLVGSNKHGVAVNDSYWDTETSGQNNSNGGTGLTTAEMHTKSRFSGFNFSSTWTIVDGMTSPMLSSEYSTTIYNAHQLQLMATDLSANYILGADIDASATSTGKSVWGIKGFSPIGSKSTPFSGTLDGKGYTISNLMIDLETMDNVGLFGYTSTSANIRNVGLSSGTVTGKNSVGTLAGTNKGAISNSYAAQVIVTGKGNKSSGSGGLVGTNGGTISTSHTSGSVTGIDDVGGLAGVNGGQIDASYSIATVTNAEGKAGGLVGTNNNNASISASYAVGVVGDVGTTGELGGLVGLNNGSISYSNALVRVDCGDNSSCGGLVGKNDADNSNGGISISNSYATGGVNGTGNNVGGLVGINAQNSTIDTTYATGHVVGQSNTNVGLLVGNNSGTIKNSRWNSSIDKQKKGVGENSGTTPDSKELTAVQMLDPSNFKAFSIDNTPGNESWVFINIDGSLLPNHNKTTGATSPMLATEYSTTINNAHQLQLMVMDLGASYSMGADVDASGTGNGNEVWGTLGFVPIRIGNTNTPFTGVFDGQLHKVSKLRISRTDNNVGLFGYTSNATIRNVGLSDALINGVNTVGGLVGYSAHGSISNSYVSGYIYGTHTYSSGKGDNIGGLVGYNNNGTINNSSTSGIAYGGNFVGGLVGQNIGTINNSYSATNANARTGKSQDGKNWGMVGGLVGKNNFGTVNSSYAKGHVIERTNTNIGGLIGYNVKKCSWFWWCRSGQINNSYWDITTSGQTSSAGGTGLSVTQMRQQSSFHGWDFTNTWKMQPYPVLRNLPAGYTP